jgi:superfamily II DNA or RNA helicase
MTPESEGFREYWTRTGWKGTWSAEDDRVTDFYVPLLERAGAYDRMAGYFTSSALSLAAAGLSSFVANGGVMRLIVGAQLDPDDIAAIDRGEPLSEAVARVLLRSDVMGDVEHVVAEHRRNVLGWLVKEGRLEIKVGVPVDPETGRALRPAEATKYFHSKYGIFTDCTNPADRVAFIGSDNETWQGWVGNHETFAAAPTWRTETWDDIGAGLVSLFDAHWRDRPDEGWTVLSLHDAVQGELIKWAKGDAPPVGLDPEAHQSPPPPPSPWPVEFDPRLADLAAAPRKGGGTFVGLVTAGVEPLPHQTSLVRRAVETWPRGYFLADEVGLGKTIEAGFIIRELLLSGKADRFLLLVPASVLRQWQEELSEKLNLRVNRYDGGEFLDPDGKPVAASGTPWAAFPIVLASSHLARRRDRMREVLAAGPWDVVLVDEAHHARRSGGKPNGTPNQLLKLLEALKENNAYKALFLASATPMQMHPHEAWDLVELLGLPGHWADSSREFVRYFSELREDFERRHWGFLTLMAHDSLLDPAARPDPILEEKIDSQLNLAEAVWVRQVANTGLTQSKAKGLGPELQAWVDAWLLTNNPMRERVFRNTRRTLRAYNEAGMLPPGTIIPTRKVVDDFIQMTDAERELYERIRSYIKRSYNRYMLGNHAQKALGFIMTVYRRRLTSSFQSIRLSLERRKSVLEGKLTASHLLDRDGDDVMANPTLPIDWEVLEETPIQELENEIWELNQFIKDLEALPADESKMARLHQYIDASFKAGHDTVLIFTQYTDTMNYVVDQLSTAYGSRVMSYSGSGGRRRLESGEWIELSKKETKRLFREGREIKILVGTDALSEGLNLQTCGRLINYDMPWNFMRVEQRIGRVDRINGQPLVEVTNLFYENTIEEQIYRGISAGHDDFSWVVGPAQPVLASVEDAIVQYEMGPEESSGDAPKLIPDQPVAQIVQQLLAEIQEAAGQAVTVKIFDNESLDPSAGALSPEVTLEDVERILLDSPATREQLYEHPMIDGAWLVEDEVGNKLAVTFDRSVLDGNSPEVRLLSFGDPLFDLVLKRAGVGADPAPAQRPLTIAEQLGEMPLGDKL